MGGLQRGEGLLEMEVWRPAPGAEIEDKTTGDRQRRPVVVARLLGLHRHMDLILASGPVQPGQWRRG